MLRLRAEPSDPDPRFLEHDDAPGEQRLLQVGQVGEDEGRLLPRPAWEGESKQDHGDGDRLAQRDQRTESVSAEITMRCSERARSRIVASSAACNP